MRDTSHFLELKCPACAWTRTCGPEQMRHWLIDVKMLRKNSDPDLPVLMELFRTSAAKLTCPSCGNRGLVTHEAQEDDDENWGMARPCEVCGAPIPAERLEIFPETRLCVRCQGTSESGGDLSEVQYCPRCGGVMTLKQSRGAGITRYVMTCTSCR